MGQSFSRSTEMPARTAPAFGVTAVWSFPLTANLDKIDIQLTGTVDVTVAAAALVGDGAPEIIKSIDLVGDGNVVICSIPFATLVNGNMWRRFAGLAPAVSQPSLLVGVNAFSALATLDLKSFASLRPKDTTLVETSFRVLELRAVIASDFTGAISGGTVLVSGSSIAMNIVAHETIELPDARGATSLPSKRAQYSSTDIVVAGAASRQYKRLTPGQHLRGLTLRVQNAAGTVDTDGILTAVRLYIGNSQRYNVSGAGIVSKNQSQMLAARPVGYYYLNFTEQQGSVERLNDEIDLRLATLGGADAYMEFDTNAAAVVRITQWGHIDI